MTSQWHNLHKNGDKFTGYFMKEKAEIICESATADIHSTCGLGFPPKVYTQNASECMNQLVKAEEDSKFTKKADGPLPSIENAYIIDIPFSLLKGMFSKAATTVSDQTAVLTHW